MQCATATFSHYVHKRVRLNCLSCAPHSKNLDGRTLDIWGFSSKNSISCQQTIATGNNCTVKAACIQCKPPKNGDLQSQLPTPTGRGTRTDDVLASTDARLRARKAGTTDGRPAGRPARRGRKRHQSEMRYVGGFDVCEAHLNSSKIPDPPLPWHPICGPSLTLHSSSLCCGGLPGDLVFNVVSEEP